MFLRAPHARLLALALLVGCAPDPSAITWVEVAPGSFSMGCDDDDPLCPRDADPAHDVTITRGFDLTTTEITQAQWEATMGSRPSRFDTCGETCPVERVSWVMAVAFANALSETEGLPPCYNIDGIDVAWPDGLDCEGYRLPTEAEWEYAALAGQDTWFSGSDNPFEVGWFGQDLGALRSQGPVPVGLLAPNAWGLHDMSGNVDEWVWDRWGDYGAASVTDPLGDDDGYDRFRVHRGASWSSPDWAVDASFLVVKDRGLRGQLACMPDLGLRLARTRP